MKRSDLAILLILFSLLSCSGDKKQTQTEVPGTSGNHIVNIVTENMEFQVADEIPSGWITFRYINKSNQVHFFLIDHYPEGKTIEDARKYVVPVFQEGMDLINEGKPDDGLEAFGKLPEWFGEVKFLGGSGMVSPDETAETTLFLDPGYYLLECYIKMANGMFHSSLGMIKELTVTTEKSTGVPPVEDIEIDISSTQGIVIPGKIAAGRQVFKVNFRDQVVHENFVGHDVNLVRLKEGADLNVLEKWVNWADPQGLINPPPEGMTFLGGVNDMPAGKSGYFTVYMVPGQYAMISEVPNTLEKNLLKTFSVEE